MALAASADGRRKLNVELMDGSEILPGYSTAVLTAPPWGASTAMNVLGPPLTTDHLECDSCDACANDRLWMAPSSANQVYGFSLHRALIHWAARPFL